ncbi:MAG TPA: 2Fe-2S iron-sulfur cluster binding domain-containing protein [Candidatus Krumholzibacteria bacterium]|nr:2Fe-2S iron-sulfur cluster binding domain-containing protein [Candidatus Krumholzibacteria bacterium]
MARVTFHNDDLTVDAEPGTTLSLVAFQNEAGLPFGCRAGTCGTCVLTVVEGAEGLDEPGFVEDDTLAVCGEIGPGRRLGCQIIVRDTDLAVEW